LNPGIWIAIFLPIIIVTISGLKNKRLMMRNKVRKKRLPNRGDGHMNELIKDYVGKECTVLTFEGGQVKGIIEKLEGNWISVTTAKKKQMINTDFISRIIQKNK
jgi:hypothetical protein